MKSAEELQMMDALLLLLLHRAMNFRVAWPADLQNGVRQAPGTLTHRCVLIIAQGSFLSTLQGAASISETEFHTMHSIG